jgi:hypothetical protein
MSARPRESCALIRSQLALAAGQDLGDVAARGVWNHLARCMECRREYSAFLELRELLGTLEPGNDDGRAAAAGATTEPFFARMQQDILAAVVRETPARPHARAWAAAAVALISVGVAVAMLANRDAAGLLGRAPIAPVAMTRPTETLLTPLSYPQGLEAQRQVDLLFTPGHEMPTWPVLIERPDPDPDPPLPPRPRRR